MRLLNILPAPVDVLRFKVISKTEKEARPKLMMTRRSLLWRSRLPPTHLSVRLTFFRVYSGVVNLVIRFITR